MLLLTLYIIGITAESITGALAAGREKMDMFGFDSRYVARALSTWLGKAP